MIKSLVSLALLMSSLISGCVSTTHLPPSSLPTNSLEDKITAVENHIPVKGWFKWTEKTIIDRMEHYNVPGVSIAVINDHKIEWAKGYGTLESGNDIPVNNRYERGLLYKHHLQSLISDFENNRHIWLEILGVDHDSTEMFTHDDFISKLQDSYL